MNELILSPLFYVAESLGILSFALSGFILAKQKDFDVVGVYIIALVTAFGGGTIRDVVLDIQPVYWINHAEYPLIIFIMVLFLSFLKKLTIRPAWLLIPDALGLSLFAITGAQVAHQAGHPIIIVAILATVVATFGGVLRDSLCQEIPLVFRKESTLYASLAFLGGMFYVGLTNLGTFSPTINMTLSVALIFISRLIAYKMNWRVRI